jgi:hypothetical protein
MIAGNGRENRGALTHVSRPSSDGLTWQAHRRAGGDSASANLR